jgi:serine/threonine protein kinase/tetratricopeptide (TPR) repeat protein
VAPSAKDVPAPIEGGAALGSASRPRSEAPRTDDPRIEDGDLSAGAPIGRFLVLKKLGQGGMGIVYLAIDPELERRIAIKLVHAGPPGSDDSSREARARLLREAQAMAKLSHPNVVTVFEVGTLGDQVFIAMEYVPGVTLRAWLDEVRRTPREIIAVFAQAGRGLAAAHDSGLLHRDFKPDNVMVTADGRAHVLDFGLARRHGGLDTPEQAGGVATLGPSSEPVPGSAFDHRITRTGALVGTPAYMPPELLNGVEIDARSDQFSFCVALWEALYGERPCRGKDVVELVKTVTRGERTEPRDRRGVPRGVHQVITRGLSVRADQRYPDMRELLTALEHASAAPRRTAAAAAIVGALGVAVALAWYPRTAPPPPCAGSEQEIAQIWNDAQRAAIATAFARSGNPRADATWERVRSALDSYATSWASMRKDSCEATRVRGTQSDEALDLRTACLDQRRRELKASADVLATATGAVVDNAVTMVRTLSSLDQCANVSALKAPYARPRDETQRRAVDAVRERVATSRALLGSRRLTAAEAESSAAAADAAKADYPPLEAEARLVMAMSLDLEGKAEDALAAALDAAVLANRIRSDVTEATALIWLVRIAGYDLGHYADGELYARLADAAVARAGGGALLRADLTRNRAHALYAKGDNDNALALYREALSLRERALGADAPEVAAAQLDVADVLRNTGAIRESIALDQTALTTRINSLGEGNPSEAVVLISLANAYEAIGDFARAEQAARRALATSPEQGQLRGFAHLYIARAVLAEGDVAGGEAGAQSAFAELAAVWGPTSWKLGANRSGWALTLLRRHLEPAALREAEAGIALLAPTEQSADGLRGAREARALCLARLGPAKEALAAAESVLAEEDKATAPGNYAHLLPELAVGEAALATKDSKRALTVLEASAAAADKTEPFPEFHADVHLALARALLASRGDAGRAKALAERAGEEYERTGLAGMATEARRVAGETAGK